ncbi:putative atp-dependent rna helicase protein [Sesbania bispinosa]|nr:putative atp-dependent rna helicase protein [Sesbania bispinosa]
MPPPALTSRVQKHVMMVLLKDEIKNLLIQKLLTPNSERLDSNWHGLKRYLFSYEERSSGRIPLPRGISV